MGAVLLIFGNQDTSWNNMKKFLGQSSVIKNIIDFDPRVMTQDLRRDVQAMI
jgi:dynein heavy chain 2